VNSQIESAEYDDCDIKKGENSEPDIFEELTKKRPY
jgi:hypothetical protein